MKKSLYDLVGVPPEAPREMIGSACKRRIAKLERSPGEEAKAEIYAIREAWSILGDESLRAGYDASLATAQAGPGASPIDSLAARLGPEAIASELLRPRRLWAQEWERYRKLVFVLLFVGLVALSTIYNQGNRAAVQKRIEAANYEAEYGEPMPGPKPAATAQAAGTAPEEPFSAEKFEREMKEREAQLKDQVAREQTANEDEFRNKLRRENSPGQGRRYYRNR